MYPSITEVSAAAERGKSLIRRTPVIHCSQIDRAVGAHVSFKGEHLQKTGSFKSRGALNAVLLLPPEASSAGVVSVSAGNHAQALAWAAATQGIKCTVVMPAAAAQSKVDASREYGANVLFAESGAAAFAQAEQIARDQGAIFVHPFDDPAVIAGAGTVGAELAEQLPGLDAVVVPVGGGGLIAGVAIAMRALSPHTRIYGVEPEGAASMHQSIHSGAAATLSTPPRTIADGLAAPMSGKLNYEVVRDLVDDIVLVSDDAIRQAMRLLISRSKQLTEPAGAAALAALLIGVIPDVGGKKVAAILSGGNVDLERLAAM